jgi:tetratricopeptide (TPR) repeat protein
MLRLCALVAVMLPSLAWAQPDLVTSDEERTRRARLLFEQGRAHVDLGDYASATREFEAAYVLKPLPLFLYNLAELAVAQKQRQHALRLYERYVQEERDPAERARIESRIAELRASLAQNPAADPPLLPPPRETSPPPLAAPAAAPAPAASLRSPAATTAVAMPPRHTRRWIWGVAVGGAVLVAGAITLGVVLGSSAIDPTPSLGTGHLR